MKRSLKAALAAMLALVMALSSLTLGVLAVPEAINEQEIASEAHEPIYFVETGKHLKGADTTPKAIGAGAYYNVDAAVAYARAHALDTPQYPGADCANFTSHCLAAGGITIPNYAYYNSNHPRYDNLGKLNGFTNPYTCSAAQLVYLSEYYPVIKNPSFSQIELGDIVFTNNYDGDPDGHVVIITGFRGNTPLYCGHTNAKLDAPLGSGQAKYAVKMSTYNNLTPPAAPTNLHTVSGKTLFSCNEYIEFAWDASAGATNYWCYMWKDGVELYGTDMGNSLSFLSAPTSAGNYTFIVRAGNSAGYSDSSAYVYFTVYDSAPAAPTNVHAVSGRTLFSCNEYIEFAWNASETATTYWVYMWKDGVELYGTDMGNSLSFLSAPTSAGNYTFIVRAGNSAGYSDSSAYVYFTVYDSAPAAPTNLHTVSGKTMFSCNEYIEFAWNASATATGYLVSIYKEGYWCYDSILDAVSAFTSQPTEPGNYTMVVKGRNDFGYGDATSLDFSVCPQIDNQLPCNIGSDFYAFIEHQSTGLLLTNQLDNIAGETACGDERQIWRFCRQSNGAYAIISAYDNSCMNVWGSYIDNGTNVYAYNGGYLGNPNQQFWIYSAFGSYYFIPVHTDGNHALDMSLSTHNLEIWELGADWAPQKFNIINTTYPIAVTPGDIDSNGTVTMLDALLALRMGMGMLPLTNLEAADMNGDGAVTVIDALMIMRLTMGTA